MFVWLRPEAALANFDGGVPDLIGSPVTRSAGDTTTKIAHSSQALKLLVSRTNKISAGCLLSPTASTNLPISPGGIVLLETEFNNLLVVSRKIGERILIGDKIAVTVVKVGNGGVRIGVEAPAEMPIVREELAEQLRLAEEAKLEAARDEPARHAEAGS